MLRYRSYYEDYNENNYAKVPRITNEAYRKNLVSWQIPAIKKHCGDLTNKSFIDIGAGDIVLGEYLNEIGTPKIFYAQDLSEHSLKKGIKRIKNSGVEIEIFRTITSDNFNFSEVNDLSLDYAFSNSLFSHLSINSILLCLKNLAPKMNIGSKYFSSMVVVPKGSENHPYDWSYLKNKGTNIISYPTQDPYHYSIESIYTLSYFNTGFKVVNIHEYGHPFQKLVEFAKNESL